MGRGRAPEGRGGEKLRKGGEGMFVGFQKRRRVNENEKLLPSVCWIGILRPRNPLHDLAVECSMTSPHSFTQEDGSIASATVGRYKLSNSGTPSNHQNRDTAALPVLSVEDCSLTVESSM